MRNTSIIDNLRTRY